VDFLCQVAGYGSEKKKKKILVQSKTYSSFSSFSIVMMVQALAKSTNRLAHIIASEGRTKMVVCNFANGLAKTKPLS